MSHHRTAFLVVTILCTAISCRDRIPDSPADAARLGLRALQKGTPQPVFHALPEVWRSDVQALAARMVGAVEPTTWDAAGEGLALLVDGISRHPEAALTLPIPIRGDEDRIRVLQILVSVLEHIEDAGLLRHETAKNLDLDRLLGDPGDEVLPLLLELAERTRSCPASCGVHEVLLELAALRRDTAEAEVEGGEEVEGTATLVIRFGDQRREMPFVRVEERWVPRLLAEAWAPGKAAAEASLDAWIIRWTENRGAARIRVEAFRAAAEHFATSGEVDALVTTFPAF